jgi:hypothetical protein
VPVSQPDWTELSNRFPPELVNELQQRFDRGEPFQYSAEQFASNYSCSVALAQELLEALASTGFLSRSETCRCPSCDQRLTTEPTQLGVCEHCGSAFNDIGVPPPIEVYCYEGTRTRDVRWLLALHGMNTRGPWQEVFSWLISRTYGHSVPVAIYKYGLIRPSALIRFRQRALVRELTERVHCLVGETMDTGFGGIPDVIAHSFGTWLIGHALNSDRKLKVGRILLLGSILRPDFDWNRLIESGQVNAVLCHCGTKDFCATISEFIIPDSGPSGRIGFCHHDRVLNVRAVGLRHGGFFSKDIMPDLFKHVWAPFLTKPDEAIAGLPFRFHPTHEWRQAWWLFRATIPRYLLLLFTATLVVGCVLVFALGLYTLAICLNRPLTEVFQFLQY